MKTVAKENLMQLMRLLNAISQSDYTNKNDILSGATISQHIRHILEFYLLLIAGSFTNTISYDKRERDVAIENHPSYAIKKIEMILAGLETLSEEDPVKLEADYSVSGKSWNTLNSTVGRELAYCIEHSIHHQALIKAGLIGSDLKDLTDKDFGVAYSTIRYRDGSDAK